MKNSFNAALWAYAEAVIKAAKDRLAVVSKKDIGDSPKTCRYALACRLLEQGIERLEMGLKVREVPEERHVRAVQSGVSYLINELKQLC